jgi:glycosyltransferase involved in cell wall biosynthesis
MVHTTAPTVAPTFSVVIPCYNREHFIRETIESALQQTYPPLEIIVVDDGSSDRSATVIRETISPVPILYHHQSNQGPSAARNLGASLGRGEWVAFLDSDDLWYPNKLSVIAKILRVQPEVTLFYSQADHIDVNGQPVTKISPAGGVIRLLFGDGPFAGPSTLVVHREVFLKSGGFNPAIHYGEDVELFARLAQSSRVHVIHDSLIKYRVHDDQTSKNIGSHIDSCHRYLSSLMALWSNDPWKRVVVVEDASKLFNTIGKQYFRDGAHKLARRCFLLVFQYRPFDLMSFRYLVLSYLPGLRYLSVYWYKRKQRRTHAR